LTVATALNLAKSGPRPIVLFFSLTYYAQLIVNVTIMCDLQLDTHNNLCNVHRHETMGFISHAKPLLTRSYAHAVTGSKLVILLVTTLCSQKNNNIYITEKKVIVRCQILKT